MSNWIKLTNYGKQDEFTLVITCPHGSDGHKFFQNFPHLKEVVASHGRLELWESYLAIEKDEGSVELAHAIARHFERISNAMNCQVLEFDYPRGLIDGGRILDHCLRSALPSEILAEEQEKFLQIHQLTLDYLDRLYGSISERSHFWLDLHTMASFNPIQLAGLMQTIPISWHQMQEYLDQYRLAPRHSDNLRKVDLITSSPCKSVTAHPYLRQSLQKYFSKKGLPHSENHPFDARPEYLMFRHLMQTQSIAIDVPKHMLSTHADPCDFDLFAFELCQAKLDELGETIAQGLYKAIERLRDPSQSDQNQIKAFERN